MGNYIIMAASRQGVRVVDRMRGETARAAGRVLDNMSIPAARDAIVLLERLDGLRREHIDSAHRRNDLVAILEASASH